MYAYNQRAQCLQSTEMMEKLVAFVVNDCLGSIFQTAYIMDQNVGFLRSTYSTCILFTDITKLVKKLVAFIVNDYLECAFQTA